MISPANENQVDGKTTCRIANERLRMDDERLKQAGISVEKSLFWAGGHRWGKTRFRERRMAQLKRFIDLDPQPSI